MRAIFENYFFHTKEGFLIFEMAEGSTSWSCRTVARRRYGWVCGHLRQEGKRLAALAGYSEEYCQNY